MLLNVYRNTKGAMLVAQAVVQWLSVWAGRAQIPGQTWAFTSDTVTPFSLGVGLSLRTYHRMVSYCSLLLSWYLSSCYKGKLSSATKNAPRKVKKILKRPGERSTLKQWMCTQRPQVWIQALLSWTVEIENQTHLVLMQRISQIQCSKGLSKALQKVL